MKITQNEPATATNSPECLGGDARFDELMKRLRASGIGKSVSASEWAEVEEFINENIRPEGVVNQEEWERGRAVGVTAGRAEIKIDILNKAAELFKAGKDEEAKHLRSLANTILP